MEPFTQPGAMTSLGTHAAEVARLPSDPAALARVVQGILLHEHWAETYGVELAPERREESHLRSTESMLARVVELDPRPLAEARPPERRLIGTCRDFAVLHTAFLRAHGVAARARCGFAGYFEAGRFVDHWVTEHWRPERAAWVLFDAQLDGVQCAAIEPDFAPSDVPRDRFLVGGDAWRRCRNGAADPERFGIFDLWGLWFVAGDVVRDGASLCGTEMPPWDCWGAMPDRTTKLDEATLALLDRTAELGRAAGDEALDELRALYSSDERLRVPARVFNALRNQLEPI